MAFAVAAVAGLILGKTGVIPEEASMAILMIGALAANVGSTKHRWNY